MVSLVLVSTGVMSENESVVRLRAASLSRSTRLSVVALHIVSSKLVLTRSKDRYDMSGFHLSKGINACTIQ